MESEIRQLIMMKELINRTEVLVRFNEADPLGIVWHGHYVTYMEVGREAFGNEHGLSYLQIFKQGFVAPVVNVNCDFKRQLRYGDSVIVETKYIPTDAAKMKFTYRLLNAATGDLAATGTTIQVFLDKEENLLQLNNPVFFAEWKKSHGLG